MKLIKQFTVLVVCFVVLSSSFMVGYAVDDGIYEPLLSVDDFYDMGYVEDENGDLILPGRNKWFDFDFSLFTTSEKNYPHFDPVRDIPWSTFPEHIKDIIFMDTSDLSKHEGSFLVPFVCAVMVSAATCQLFVGTNVAWGRLNDSNISLGIFSLPNDSNACLYRFAFSIITGEGSWTEYKPSAFGNKGNLSRILPYYWNDSSILDIYGYGANGISYCYRLNDDGSISSISSKSILYNSSNPDLSCSFAFHPRGFSSGRIISDSVGIYPFIFTDSFKIPTDSYLLQQEQNSLLDKQNGILDELLDEFRSSGESELTTLPDEALDDYNKAESDLVSGYNPDNIEDDLDIELDPSALKFIWDLFDEFVTADNAVFTLFISIMAVGIIALILGR